MTDIRQEMTELIQQLNEAARAYYQENRELISNLEYDALYDRLAELEEKSGIILSGSPTTKVGFEIVSELPKERHTKPALSLDKTKEISALSEWLGDKHGVLSWKLDGLTVVLTYRNGELEKAVTRGNGEIGEVVTPNAKVFANLPIRIAYQKELVVRGEAVIRYSDFDKINASIEEVDAKYKNPRNLCSGSVRQLNSEITAKRNVHFFAFSLEGAEEEENSRIKQLDWLEHLGFSVVEYREVTADTVAQAVSEFSNRISFNDFPSDGLVLSFDDIAYGISLGTTSKFPRDSIAFKWADEIAETKLLEIEWSASRTGLINPIAIFEPVELEGTTVSRASVHNISIMENLALGIGDTIEVYKANMIIPQIAKNLTRSGVKDIPKNCPICGGKTSIKQENDVKSLYCTNATCLAKKIKSFTHFVSRDAMNIEGLSEATLEKLIAEGFIKKLSDIFHLKQHQEKIINLEGFGERSFQNLIDSIEKARKTTVVRFLYSLGIQNIGLSNAKLICKEYDYDFQKIRQASLEDLTDMYGVGQVIANAFISFFEKTENQMIVDELLKEITWKSEEIQNENQTMKDLVFVITGSVEHFANRNAMKAEIERKGGRVTGTVSANTSYLINNDRTSNSSKNKKAKELGVPILTEEELITNWFSELLPKTKKA